MPRMRFRREERQAFTPGVRVEWCNGSRWGNFGTVAGEITRPDRFEVLPVRNEKATRTGSGPFHETYDMTPGKVRLPE